MTPNTLTPEHAALIEGSAISAEVAQARGYRSVATKAALEEHGFSEAQRRVPALLIPIHSVRGEVENYQIRPNAPRVIDGKPMKYETPARSRVLLDVPPTIRHLLGKVDVPLFITEGARKADAAASINLACISVLGVWNFRGRNDDGGLTALADWETVALKGKDGPRHVYVVYDSDVMTKPAVNGALRRLKAFLESRGARVRVIYLPSGEGATKVGLDDFLAAGNGVDALLALASDELRPLPSDGSSGGLPYVESEHGIFWRRPTSNGEQMTPLTNFTARITAEVEEDDGAEVQRFLEITGRVGARQPTSVTIPAQQFAAMNWVIGSLGARAVINPAFGARNHVPAAIQMLSGDMPTKRVYTHTGWRELPDGWVYLHAAGAIGAHGTVPDVQMGLTGPLAQFVLPEPPTGDERRAAIRASLGLLALGPDPLVFPLLAATYRAAMGQSDSSVYLVGRTGVFKSELAALAQQHFGAAMDARNLPGNWASTANALEGMAFSAKDALLVVDDFAPGGSKTDVDRLQGAADRLFRGQGNGAGRIRMRQDASIRPAKPPRGLLLATGEDVPRGQSLRARTLIIEIAPGMINVSALSARQRDAAAGLYAHALAGFVAYLAAAYGALRPTFQREIQQLRDMAGEGGHRRTPALVADLGLGLHQLLDYALVAGAITGAESTSLWERGWAALMAAGEAQSEHQQHADPATRYLDLLSGALASGAAHVASMDGDSWLGPNRKPEAWGWSRVSSGPDPNDRSYRSNGPCIGWLQGTDLYLQPDAAFAVAHKMADQQGEALSINPRTLHKRLNERGLLLSRESPGRLLVKRTIAGERLRVLHLSASSLNPEEPGQSGQPGPA